MTSTRPTIRERFHHFRNTLGPVSSGVFWVLLALWLGAVIYLISTGGPWEKALVTKRARGTELSWQQYRQLGIGWGMVGLTVVLGVAVGSVRWWGRPATAVLSHLPRPKQGRKAVRWYALGLLLTAGLALFLRMPRLTHSFWNDEAMAFEKYVYGENKVLADGTLVHEPIPWGQALFENEKANNQVWSTVESRLGMALFNQPEKGSPTGVPAFQESAPRIIPLVSSALTILALGWLGWLLGVPRIGLAAALLMALSPWHMRYSVEIRGYSTMLFAMLMALGCLVRALETNGWRWWVGFAVAQALYLLSFAGAVYVAMMMNVLALVCIWQVRREPLSNSLRLVVANALSAVPLAIFLTPSLLQVTAYLAEDKKKYAPMGWAWVQDLWSHLVTAMPWGPASTQGSHGISVEQLSEGAAWIKPVMMVVLPVWCLLGIAAMLRQDWRARLITGSLLLGALGACGHAMISKGPFYSWYLVYLLPVFCISLPYVSRLAPRLLRLLPLVAVGLFYILTQVPRERMKSVARQPMREAAQWARAEATVPVGQLAEPVSAVFGRSAGQIFPYDPRAILLKSPAQLTQLMANARKAGTPLAVYFCDRISAEQEHADLLAILQEPADWDRKVKLPGLEQMWSYEVYLLVNLSEAGQPLKVK